MKLELDDEVTDAIVVATLKEHIKIVKDQIKKLKKAKKLETHQQQDLGYSVHLLDSLEEVHDYFGGSL